MSAQDIIGIIKENFVLALALVIMLGLLFILAYYFVYKKVLKGRRELSKRQLLFSALLIGYLIMVLGVTFFNRTQGYQGRVELNMFRSYREAWYRFSASEWQFIYLNILMFVPLGLLLPLWRARFHKARWMLGLAAIFTLSIETFQLLTGLGNFMVDDLFNNLLGAIIGYGLIMGILTVAKKRFKLSLLYFSPLLLIVIVSVSMYSYYQHKEFGNLPIMANLKPAIRDVSITFDGQLDKQRRTAPIYQAPAYSKEEADEFVYDFFKRMQVNPSGLEIIYYQDQGVYQHREEKSYDLWVEFLDGSYDFTDFTSFDVEKQDEDEKILLEKLDEFGIHLPAQAQFQKVDTGVYEWKVKKIAENNQLIDGAITAEYYQDDTVKRIDNQLITYEKVKDVSIKSEAEAYEELAAGKFYYYSENRKLENLNIHTVELDYQLDSKGYNQPVYAFYCTIDGEEKTIYVPAL